MRGESGYTLIELLVVLLLTGFIATAIGAGLHFGTRAWERSQAVIAGRGADETARTILRRLLASAVPHRMAGFTSFSGEPSRVAFDTEPPGAFGASGLVRVELSLRPEPEGTRLMLKAVSLIDPRKSRETVLDAHLGRASFAFLDASGKVPVWLSFWRDRKGLPDAVRLESAAPWPAFVAALPVAQDADCVFDPVSMDCRGS